MAQTNQITAVTKPIQLAVEVEEVRTELSRFAESEVNETKIMEFTAAIEQLTPLYEDLKFNKERRSIISKIESISDHDKQAENKAEVEFDSKLNSLRTRWDEQNTTIRQADAFSEFVTATNDYTNILKSNNEQSWVHWRNERQQNFVVSEIELNAIRNIPQYTVSCTKYLEDTKIFQALTEGFPNNQQTINQASKLAEGLTRIRKTFKFDELPDYISAFFNELNDQGSVTLERVTDDVLKWLRENKALKSLSVLRTTRTP